MFKSIRSRAKAVATIGVAAALALAGVAVAQSGSGSGKSQTGKPPSGKPMPPPPGGPMGKDLTYAQFHVQHEGTVQVIRLDRGTVVSTSESSITLKENDGSEVTIAVDGETKVLAGPGRNTSVTDLKAGQEVTVCGPEGGTAKAIMVPPKKGQMPRGPQGSQGQGQGQGQLPAPPPGGQFGGPQGGPQGAPQGEGS
jgi:hypothetical protein